MRWSFVPRFSKLIRMIARTTTLMLLPLAVAAVDIEALRLFVEETPGQGSHPVLAYRTHGEQTTLRDVLVELRIGEGDESRRLRYRLREARVPQSEHHFHMPLEMQSLDLEKGRHRLEAWIDSGESVAEADEGNNRAVYYFQVPGSGAPQPPAETEGHRIGPFFHESELAGGRSWTDPLEVGFHPAYGSSEAVLMFRHPGAAAGTSALRLHLEALEIGRPLQRLGPLRITARSLPRRRAGCSEPEPTIAEVTDLGSISIEAPGNPSCAGALELRLALPDPPDPGAEVGALLRIDPEGTWILFGAADSRD